MNKKNKQSQAQFGTLTATSDANNDYASSKNTTSSSATTSNSMAEYGTMTAKFDANNDYGGKPGNQNKSGNDAQSGSKKDKTSDKNIGR